ncbi:PaaI family thioesterase [Nocardia sp. NPDC051030]|uniref:PaaI family thioesterase n=1 Tax=Nocardia sp. NPDC051030 TaxID=3155162 RepID=UPI003439130D
MHQQTVATVFDLDDNEHTRAFKELIVATQQTGMDSGLGIRYDLVTPDSVQLSIDLGPQHHQPAGIVHGGVYTAIVEAAGSSSGSAWLAHHQTGQTIVGVTNTTDFLRPMRHGRAIAVSTPVHRGRTQQLWLVEIRDADSGKLVARGHLRGQNVRIQQ